MKKYFKILTIYLLLLLAIVFGIPSAKSAFTGTSGPHTAFISSCVLAPSGLILLGWRGAGLKGSLRNFFLVVLLFTWLFLSYPMRPPMNFIRQLTHDIEFPLFVTFIVAAVVHARQLVVQKKL